MNAVSVAVTLFSVLFPVKGWYAPDQPLLVTVKPQGEVLLVLADFGGRIKDMQPPISVKTEATLDLREHMKELERAGTYVLYAIPKGQEQGRSLDIEQFVGTPLVIEVRPDPRGDAPPGPMVIRVSPLTYGVIHTSHGEMTCVFYYDSAPHTIANFLSLAEDHFYDGLRFHRIVPGFVIQGGDPIGNGTGGPGYTIDAEFNERRHLEGVLSMARQSDPIEREGALPRSEFANSAGSQFFICLNYEKTRQLDRRYTAFGRVVRGMDVVRAVASTPVADRETGRPSEPQVIDKITIHPVTPEQNPYSELLRATVGEGVPQAVDPALR